MIGRGSIVGGNAYVTESVPPNSRVVPDPPRNLIRDRNGESSPEQLHWEI